jgi:3-hydroxyacyl-CoA dehydrogenase
MEDIDAATGPAIGGPRSATFRTIDLVGLDVVAAVATDLARRLPGHGYDVPDAVGRMLERGLIGVKAGQGFYKRAADASRTILVLDPATLDYRAPMASALSFAGTGPVGDRIRGQLAGTDRAGDLVRRTLGATLLYAAEVATEIANSIDDVDRAMRWGFGWQMGPFEMWDTIGIRTVLDVLRPAAAPVLIQSALDRGREALRDGPLPPAHAGLRLLTTARQSRGVVRTAPGASLVDLDDGVFCVELHSKMNVIGRDALEMLQTGIEHASSQGIALVVASEGEHFSAGADLRQILAASQESRWAELDVLVRGFQAVMTAVKTARVPVVAAPAGLALGGGCELCLHASRIDAAAETYIGLSEASVGLIPAGGGTKEMLLRATGAADVPRAIAAAFRTIATAAVSTSAPHARALGYLGARDGITMNRERVTAAAKDAALRSARGYRPRSSILAIPAGGAALYDALAPEVDDALARGRITAHDAVIGRKLAHVFSGGRAGGSVSEQELLDLEREAFLSLCGETATLDRIAYTLKTGKPLRN